MDLRIALENETVAEIGFTEPLAIQENQTVKAAIRHMRDQNTGCLLVLNDDRLTGIFTERDFITRVLDNPKAFQEPIKEFMTAEPAVTRTDEPIHQVLARFLTRDVRNLPVLDENDRPVGTLPVRRVVQFLADYHPHSVYNLPPDPGQIHSSREGG